MYAMTIGRVPEGFKAKMDYPDLTDGQAHILSLFANHVDRYSFPPTLEDLRKKARLKSRGSIQKYIDELVRKEYLTAGNGKRRATTLGKRFPRGLPLIGEVAAGVPIEAIENIERYVDVPPSMFRKRPDYLLRVRGESMIDSGIRNGDWIAVKMADTANPGQIVIAMHDGDVTVKELSIDNGDVVLIPHNRSMKPIRIPGDEVSIVGIYTGGLIRPS